MQALYPSDTWQLGQTAHTVEELADQKTEPRAIDQRLVVEWAVADTKAAAPVVVELKLTAHIDRKIAIDFVVADDPQVAAAAEL